MLLFTSSDLPGTLTSSKASFIFSAEQPNFVATQIAAKLLYTLNLPGIPTFTLSFLSPILTLKSTYEFVIVISFASKLHALSIPYVVISQSGTRLGTLQTCKSSTFTKPHLHILNNFNLDSK